MHKKESCYRFDFHSMHCSPQSPHWGKQHAGRKTSCRADGLNSQTTWLDELLSSGNEDKKSKRWCRRQMKSLCWMCFRHTAASALESQPLFLSEQLSFLGKQPSPGGGGGGGGGGGAAALCSRNLKVLKPPHVPHTDTWELQLNSS